jgi:Holliday junction resolvase RusA-like endonuclease
MRYRAFADECRLQGMKIESRQKVTFFIPMPKSWGKKKREEMECKPHQQTPDVDNLLKAVLDATHKQDCAVWSIWAEKRWSKVGAIIINSIDEPGVI